MIKRVRFTILENIQRFYFIYQKGFRKLEALSIQWVLYWHVKEIKGNLRPAGHQKILQSIPKKLGISETNKAADVKRPHLVFKLSH